ncbi:DUF2946 domain-containing protein [Vibrio natriegens]|uniref:DUF2946 domain-containing protein n=1 Tax=Vibrio natriegens TaxID=691 RepID=UPI0015943744|nr:DUF2946 domain-containing protein [Vibrio natriegens]NVC94072.1 DUF2946 domain-containing protein [Vibrio natriegens]
MSIKASVKGKFQYLPVVLMLLIYVAPLVSLSVAFCNTYQVAHHSPDMYMMSAASPTQIDSSHQNHDRHHATHSSHQAVEKGRLQSQSSHHQHGWCGYCELLASNSALLLFALFIPMLMFALIARIKVPQSRIGRRFSHLFPTPRAPPIFQ